VNVKQNLIGALAVSTGFTFLGHSLFPMELQDVVGVFIIGLITWFVPEGLGAALRWYSER